MVDDSGAFDPHLLPLQGLLTLLPQNGPNPPNQNLSRQGLGTWTSPRSTSPRALAASQGRRRISESGEEESHKVNDKTSPKRTSMDTTFPPTPPASLTRLNFVNIDPWIAGEEQAGKSDDQPPRSPWRKLIRLPGNIMIHGRCPQRERGTLSSEEKNIFIFLFYEK